MKRAETHWFVRHPDHVASIQLITNDDVSAGDVLFDCQDILGQTPPTSIAVGTPDNVVWPA